ncbi:purine-nucleoside phosphorylase [Massilibacterium senegalense]|uniref:purine-nucleoside phosphorylase n=1 Tax=Massilibacterium senegalense TaxID=1632858 RepID=UPI0007804A55|nr:purine-nucleoside phosphorylase [Massilibacterium senegalense]
MERVFQKVQEATHFIQRKIGQPISIGVILGSGLGEMADEVKEATIIPYEEIPHFPISTVEGHAGQLVIGQFQGKQVLMMQGRFHYYEGYSMQEVTFPVRVMKALGIETLIVTNACGGMNASFRPGDLMLIMDHLNMTGTNPLIGPNIEAFGPRFPDMSKAYAISLREVAKQVAIKQGITLQEGVYAGITGPSYMTGAELVMLRNLGADAVGMSTVPEVIVAGHMNMRVLGISCITDMAIGEELEPLTHEQVVEVANKTKPTFIALVTDIIAQIPNE